MSSAICHGVDGLLWQWRVQVEHPDEYKGGVTVSLPAAQAVAPLRYQVVPRALAVQSLGFSVAPGS